MNLYEEAVLRDWRDRAARRGQQASRRTAVQPDWRLPVGGSPHDNARRHGCFGCYRDARALQASGHRPRCRLHAAVDGQ